MFMINARLSQNLVVPIYALFLLYFFWLKMFLRQFFSLFGCVVACWVVWGAATNQIAVFLLRDPLPPLINVRSFFVVVANLVFIHKYIYFAHMLTGLSLAVNLARKKKLAQTDKKHICTRCSLSITSPIYPLKIIIQKHCKNKKKHTCTG